MLDDYGLLVPAATVSDRRCAEALRLLLETHGVRTTTAPASGGNPKRKRSWREKPCHHVPVFGEDASKAFLIICHHTS